MANDENPFAPGVDNIGMSTEPADSVYEPVDLEVGEILGRCWQIFKDNPAIVLGAFFIPVAFSMVFSGIDIGLQAAMESQSDETTQAALLVADIGTQVVSGLVSLFLQLGVIRIFLNLTRGHDAEMMMMFGEGGTYLSGLGTSILMGLAIMVGFLLLIIPGFIAAVGLQFALYVVVDKGTNPVDALQESWRLTDGHKLMIFLINLVIVLFLMAIACVTLGLGILVAAPVVALAQAVMYHSLTHLKQDMV